MRLFTLLDTQYNSFINKVQSYLSDILSKKGVSLGSNTIFGQLITVVGNAMQNIMLYIEDALIEQNKYTAQRKKSIYGLAALSGYEPSLGKAAVATVKLNFVPNNEGTYNIILKNGTVLTCTQNGLKYNVILPQESLILNIDKDNTTKYFSVVQGIFNTQRFVATGGFYYTINFKYIGNIDTDYLTVKVNNEVWQPASSVYDMLPAAKQYTFKYSVGGGIDLIFGNEVHGRCLSPNDVVEVSYLVHDGSHGNLEPELETYFVFDENLYDTNGEIYDGNVLFNITFADTDPIKSGSDPETLEQVKQMIGLNSRSLVLASPQNYKMFINRFGFCGYNRTWSDPRSMIVNSLIIKNFRSNITKGSDYFKLTESDFYLTDVQKASIYNYIRNNGGQLASTIYNIFDPELCKYAMYIYIRRKSTNYNKELIKTSIRELVGNFFANIQSDSFIPKADIIHLIKYGIAGVDSVDVYILSQKNEEALINERYAEEKYVSVNPLIGQYAKRLEYIKLYPGENPNIGLDTHGNISLKSDAQFPVLMGGWKYKNSENDYIQVVDPLTIIFED